MSDLDAYYDQSLPPELWEQESTARADLSTSARFDPGAHNVADVKAYVGDHPDERAYVRAAEELGRSRAGLLSWFDQDEEAIDG